MAVGDPFADPEPTEHDRVPHEGLTLTVARNVALTIATNSLIVVGMLEWPSS